MFDWIKKIKQKKVGDDEIFVITPEEETPEDVTPEDVIAEDVTPEDVIAEDVTPEDVIAEDVIPDESFKITRNVFADEKIKETDQKKEKGRSKKKEIEYQQEPDLGRLNLQKHVIAKRRKYLAERKKYEKEYLARVKKERKSKPKKKERKQQQEPDLGRLNLQKHVIAKRRKYLAERKKYEKEYLARVKKERKSKPKKKKASSKKKKVSVK